MATALQSMPEELEEVASEITRARKATHRVSHPATLPDPVSENRAFRRVVARHYEEHSWGFLIFSGIGPILLKCVHVIRRAIFRGGGPQWTELLAQCKVVLLQWIQASGAVRERAEFYRRHKVEDPELKQFLKSLPARVDAARLALAEWVEQKPSLSPAYRLPPAPGIVPVGEAR